MCPEQTSFRENNDDALGEGVWSSRNAGGL
jgi:hypothetical protein